MTALDTKVGGEARKIWHHSITLWAALPSAQATTDCPWCHTLESQQLLGVGMVWPALKKFHHGPWEVKLKVHIIGQEEHLGNKE